MERKKYCQITIQVSPYEARKFKEFSEKGISARKVLEYSYAPCDNCKGTTVSVFNNEGEQVLIPKGILSKRK